MRRLDGFSVRRVLVLLSGLSAAPVALAQEAPDDAPAAEAFEPCSPGRRRLNQAQDLLFKQFNAAEAEAMLQEAVRKWGCSEAATPEQVARMFLVEAGTGLLQQETDQQADQLAAARTASPETWLDPLDGLDPDVKETWRQARPVGTTDLEILGTPPGWSVLLDGQPFRDGPTPQGLHLLQVLDQEGNARWAARINLDQPEQTLVFPNDRLPETLRASFLDRFGQGGYAVKVGTRNLGWKIGGPIMMAVGGGTAAGTWLAARNVPKRSTEGTLLTVGNVTGWSLVALGAGALTYGLVAKGGQEVSVGVGPRSLKVGGRF